MSTLRPGWMLTSQVTGGRLMGSRSGQAGGHELTGRLCGQQSKELVTSLRIHAAGRGRLDLTPTWSAGAVT